MKGPNERGREDSKNTISDDLEARHQPWWRLVRVGPPKFIKLPTPWVTELWYWHKHNWRMSLAIYSIMWLCASKNLFQKTHELQPLGWKITFSGEESPPPHRPCNYYIQYHTKMFVIQMFGNHLSSLHTQYSTFTFCRCPPDEIFVHLIFSSNLFVWDVPWKQSIASYRCIAANRFQGKGQSGRLLLFISLFFVIRDRSLFMAGGGTEEKRVGKLNFE
jgi:hypothetical protein